MLVARTKSEEDTEAISARSTATRNLERVADEAASALRASAAAISPLEEDIKSFFQEIETYRKAAEQSKEETTKFLTSSEVTLRSNLAEHAQEISRELATLSETLTEDLIYQILEKDDAIKDGSYTAFVIDSVRSISSSPTEKIFDSPKRLKVFQKSR